MDLYDVHSRPFNYEPSWSYEAKLAFAQEPVWYINAETGNDLNVGTTSTTALATYAELRSRLMFPPVAFDCVVYVTGTTLDQIIIDGSFPVDSKIHILGVPTVTATGTFGAVTAKSEAGNTLVNIVSATLAANPGKLVRVTSGTARVDVRVRGRRTGQHFEAVAVHRSDRRDARLERGGRLLDEVRAARASAAEILHHYRRRRQVPPKKNTIGDTL